MTHIAVLLAACVCAAADKRMMCVCAGYVNASSLWRVIESHGRSISDTSSRICPEKYLKKKNWLIKCKHNPFQIDE